jgi:hypothetical protein
MSKVTITVNGLTLVHQASGATSTATLPDVCKAAPSLAPTPYPNVAVADDLVDGTTTVTADGGHSVSVAGASFGRSTGDEAGSGGGLLSGTTGAEATVLSYSFDVAIEGRGASRRTDKMLHNHGNTIDCAGKQLPPHAVDAKDHSTIDSRNPNRKHPGKAPDLVTSCRRGFDTNLGDYVNGAKPKLGAAWFKHKRHMTFIGRYISHDLGGHFPLDQQELHDLLDLGLAVVLIWEVSKYQAICQGSVAAQEAYGEQDGNLVETWMNQNGQGNKKRVVYFTCDFPIDDGTVSTSGGSMGWEAVPAQPPPPPAGPPQPWINGTATTGDLIAAYFRGIKKALKNDVSRIGVYGARKTLEMMMPKHAKYGWMWAFPPEPYYPPGTPPPTPPSPFPYGPHKSNLKSLAHILQYQIYPSQNTFPTKHTRVSGAGALDLDGAIKKEFGQIEPPGH